jgi:hypothetical protein
MTDDDIIYRFVKGKGWIAGYKRMQPIDVESFKVVVTTEPGRYVRYHMDPIVWNIPIWYVGGIVTE